MNDARAPSLALQRNLIVAILAAIAVAAWTGLIQWRLAMDMPMNTPTMGLNALLFLGVWIVMMIAMMFPAAAPMILTFQHVQAGRRGRGETFVSTWLFVGGYMLVWSLAGAIAFAGAAAAEIVAAQAAISSTTAARIGAMLLILAGAYQLSPLKDFCLAKCRTPTSFILTSWRDGHWGAVRMGWAHGIFCLGCCWLLFLALFPLGIMNIGVMAVVTLLIFAEKTLPMGKGIAKMSGAALLLFGVAVLILPQLLPTFQAAHTMPMD